MRIQLCGDLRLESDDGTVGAKGFPGRQGRIAFVYLATNRRAVTRDELADAIWAGALPRSWEHDLTAIVSKLRAVLGRLGLKEALRGSGRAYELALPKGSTDIEHAATSVDVAEKALRAKRFDEAYQRVLTRKRNVCSANRAAWPLGATAYNCFSGGADGAEYGAESRSGGYITAGQGRF